MLSTFDFLSTRDMLRIAYQTATETSDDPNTQNGAILVVRLPSQIPGEMGGGVALFAGSNRLPDAVGRLSERLERKDDAKYNFLEHAERDAIFAAQSAGLDLKGSILFCPWYACAPCARVIGRAGVAHVIGHKAMFDRTPDSWKRSIEHGDEILDDYGVVREVFDGEIGGCTNLFRDEVWSP